MKSFSFRLPFMRCDARQYLNIYVWVSQSVRDCGFIIYDVKRKLLTVSSGAGNFRIFDIDEVQQVHDLVSDSSQLFLDLAHVQRMEQSTQVVNVIDEQRQLQDSTVLHGVRQIRTVEDCYEITV